MRKEPLSEANIVENRRARFDYELSDAVEAGLVLLGWEVKALRARRAQLTSGYVLIRRREAWLLGMRLTPLPEAQQWAEDADRSRKLLLSRGQIARIVEHCRTPGRSCVPTRVYWKGQLAKVEIALAVGRKDYDKRQHVKDREWARRKTRVRRGIDRNTD